MAEKNIVIVGAGFSGIYAAKHLSKKLGPSSGYNIILIDKHSYFTYQTELHEVAAARVEPKHVQEDLRVLFNRRKNVKLLTAHVLDIDQDNNVVTTDVAGDIPFEHLIVSVGGDSNDFGTPGVKEHGYELWSMEQALEIRAHIEDVIAKGAAELDPEKRKALLTIAVVGSGFTGTELVGEFIEWRGVLAKKHKLDESEIKIIMLEAVPTILNMLEKRDLADKAYKYMTENGVDIQTGAMVTAVHEDYIEFKDGSTMPTHTLIWTAGVKGKDIVAPWGFEMAARGGRIVTNDYMQAMKNETEAYDNIYVTGDINHYVSEKHGVGPAHAIPQTVEGGENAAHVAALNIEAAIKGGDKKKFDDIAKFHGYAVSVGSWYTVADAKMPIINMPIVATGFFASLVKHGINLYYYTQIQSGYSIFQYMMDEFFRTADGRNPFKGAVSRLGNTLWALPLRLFLGFFWLSAATGGWAETTFPTLFNVNGFLSIVVGAALIVGLFTFPAALLSILLALIAGFTNGWDASQWLVIFASFALLNGSGRNFGLDFWIVPLLQKVIGRAWYGEQRSIYNDLHK
jgi:NADH dehydrogenase